MRAPCDGVVPRLNHYRGNHVQPHRMERSRPFVASRRNLYRIFDLLSAKSLTAAALIARRIGIARLRAGMQMNDMPMKNMPAKAARGARLSMVGVLCRA